MNPRRHLPLAHLVLVDDDYEEWLPWLEDAARAHLAKWKLVERGLVDVQVHTCRSERSFKDTVQELLGKGESVYAAVDLILPRHDTDEMPDRDLWRDLLRWCIERLEESAGRGNRFEFCVMSGDLTALQAAYSGDHHGQALERHRVRRLDKAEINQAVDRGAMLASLWEDFRAFVLDQVEWLAVPEATDESGQRSRLIWFGKDSRLTDLRKQAERIAADLRGGTYLIFSDASGYEEDWFHLVRHLRSGEPSRRSEETRRWKVLPLAKMQGWQDPEWARPFQEPPDDLLVTGADRIVEQGLDLGKVLSDSDFFERVRSGGVKAFIQFPTASSGQTLKLSLDPEEVSVLERCLQEIGVPSLAELDRDLSHARNPKLLHFPRFGELRAAGVTRRLIEHEVEQCQRHLDMEDRPLDPELACVLADLPWNGPGMGFANLRHGLQVAFQRASRDPGGGSVGVESFPVEEVQEAYDGPKGLEIRGRRLFELLSERKPLLPAQEDAGSARLHGLEELLELYTGLRRLVDLHRKLESRNLPTATQELPAPHFQALSKAHEFLDHILGSPEYLAERIDRFRRVVEDPALRHLADEVYPSLRERPEWRELVERIHFVWPFDTFPLPVSVSDYLQHSSVVPEFNPDFPKILRRYPRLAAAWNELEEKRLELRNTLQARESERWLAQCHVRENDFQPVCVLLSNGAIPTEDSPGAFQSALRAFVNFNTYLAICENRYVFEGRFLTPDQVSRVLDRIDIGPALMTLETYHGRLDREARKESVLASWHDRWPVAGRQRDAVRLAVKVASWLCEKGVVRDSEEEPIRRLAEMPTEAESCGPFGVLHMFRLVRNKTVKFSRKEFWREEGEDAWDLLRRFLAGSSRPDLRLGFAPSSGGPPVLWQRHKPPGVGADLPGRLSVLGGSDRQPLFPLDDLVRVDPEDWSVWGANSRGEDWLDLTLRNGEQPSRKPGPEFPWLPTKEAFRASELWRAAHA